MCGRYLFSMEQPTLRQLWEQARQRFPNVKMETGEIFPTHTVPVLIGEENTLSPRPIKWGFPRVGGGGTVINARSETAGEKKMFRNSLMCRRCAVPASGFYEWAHYGERQKYRFTLPEEPVLYLAGLYHTFDGEQRFVILTEPANASMQAVHDRMPVVLKRNELKTWVFDNTKTFALLRREGPPLIRDEAEDFGQEE